MADTSEVIIQVIIRDTSGKILLLHSTPRREFLSKKSHWDLPSTYTHSGETPEAAATRVVREKVGSDIQGKVIEFGAVVSDVKSAFKNEHAGLILSARTRKLRDHSAVVIDDRHDKFDWFEPAEAAEKLRPKYPPALTQRIAKLTP